MLCPTECRLQCWIAFELVFVYFLYVETKGPMLEEIAKIFDGEEAEVGHVDSEKAGANGSVEEEKKEHASGSGDF